MSWPPFLLHDESIRVIRKAYEMGLELAGCFLIPVGESTRRAHDAEQACVRAARYAGVAQSRGIDGRATHRRDTRRHADDPQRALVGFHVVDGLARIA